MNKLKALILNLEKLEKIQNDLALDDSEVKKLVVKLNRDDQLYKHGENVDGIVVGKYSKETERISKGKKRAGQKYNFKDTGEFFESFKVTYKKNIGLLIEADTIKEDEDIAEKYKNIIGISKANMEVLRKKSKATLLRKALQMLRKPR